MVSYHSSAGRSGLFNQLGDTADDNYLFCFRQMCAGGWQRQQIVLQMKGRLYGGCCKIRARLTGTSVALTSRKSY